MPWKPQIVNLRCLVSLADSGQQRSFLSGSEGAQGSDALLEALSRCGNLEESWFCMTRFTFRRCCYLLPVLNWIELWCPGAVRSCGCTDVLRFLAMLGKRSAQPGGPNWRKQTSDGALAKEVFPSFPRVQWQEVAHLYRMHCVFRKPRSQKLSGVLAQLSSVIQIDWLTCAFDWLVHFRPNRGSIAKA